MNTLIAVAMLHAAPAAAIPPMTIPRVTVEEHGQNKPMDSQIRTIAPDKIEIEYRKSRGEVPITMIDGTNGVIPMTMPKVSYDQPLVLKDVITGQITKIPGVVEHREPVVVRSKDTAHHAYIVFAEPQTEAEARAGICNGKKK